MSMIRVTRKQLYDLVWAEPMMRLARRYGVSDVALAKTCRKHDIPCPPRGHWAKKAAGKRTKQTPLPRPSDESEICLQDPEEVCVSSPALRSEVQQRMAAETEPESRIEVAENLRGAHWLVSQAKEEIEGVEKDSHGFPVLAKQSALDIHVSKASLRRSLLIMDALLKALEERGYVAARGPSVEILGVKLGFSITEQMETSKKQPEDHDLEGRYSFGHSRYDTIRVASGRLELHINVDSYWASGCQTTWRDTKRQVIENRLNQFVSGLFTVAARKKEHDEEVSRREQQRREEEFRRQEEAQRRAEKRRQLKAEQERVDLLLQQATNWKLSQDLRDFIEASKQKHLAEHQHLVPGCEFEQWLVWAHKQADRLDPLKTSPPSILDEPMPEEPEPQRAWWDRR